MIVAHPDDAEFWAGGTIAVWSAAGCKVTYLVLTDGDAGGFDRDLSRSELPGIRRQEQRDAAAILGSDDVRFLGRPEGSLTASVALRVQLVRGIRQVRPERVLTLVPRVELVPLLYELSPRPPSDRRACPHRRLPGRRQPLRPCPPPGGRRP